MANRNLTPLPMERFTLVSGERLLVAEESDFGRGTVYGRVYDDACDVGIAILSDVTGRIRRFVVSREQRDREGELLWTDLIPVPEESDTSGLRVWLYND